VIILLTEKDGARTVRDYFQGGESLLHNSV